MRSLLFVLLSFVAVTLMAQDETLMQSILEKGDLKKIEKAGSYRDKGDQFTEEANLIYQEVFAAQSDYEADESTTAKKVSKLEAKARKKQVKASSFYEKCNEIKFIIYQQYIDAFWSAFSGNGSMYDNERLIEEQADELYFQAVNYRIDAAGMENEEAEVESLAMANDLEEQAIQKQLTVLAVYYELSAGRPMAAQDVDPGEPELAPGPSQNTQSPETQPPVSEDIVINQDMIDRYNRYIESGQYVDTSDIVSRMAGVTRFDREQVLSLWEAYRSGDPEGIYVPDEFLTEELSTLPEMDTVSAGDPEEEVSADEPVEIGVVTTETVSTLIPSDEDVIYRVQVSAARSQLTQRVLSQIYYGNKTVEMIEEDGWYKYSVGDFESFDEAEAFRKSGNVDNAFIVAYRKGTQFEPLASVVEPSSDLAEPSASEAHVGMPGGLVFRIQIAANRVPFTIAQLNRIYQGSYPVELVREENWYKYQFLGMRLYSDALQAISTMSVSGAFVVAYEDGIKQDLYDAVRVSRQLEKTVQTYGRRGYIDEIEFHVQIMASKRPAGDTEISNTYAGTQPVFLIFEDGWYKYHLKTGNSYEDAVRIRQECGVSGAFVVPYRRGLKITISEALAELK